MSIRVDKHDRVTTIILDRPQHKNAINRPTADALTRAFRDFDEDASAHVAVLYGNGGTFSAGADLRAFARAQAERNEVERGGDARAGSTGEETNRLEVDGDAPLGPSRMLLTKPIIAAVEGHAVAGGLELALLCDLRVADETAIFGVFCRRFGVPLIDGGTVRLPRLIGLSRALDMILTGRAVAAEEALAMGLANRVVPRGTARAAAEALAAEIAKFPQVTMRGDRQSAYEQFGTPLAEAIKNEFKIGLASLASGEALQGAASFTEGKGRHGKFE